MIFLSAMITFAVMPALSLASGQSGVTIASLRHEYRPLLVFAPAEDEQVREQRKLLASREKDLKERQVVVVTSILTHQSAGGDESKLRKEDVVQLEAGEEAAARRRFHVSEGDFTVILIGKDGGEKLRSRTPVTMEKLIKVIDAMPMRQKEVRDGHSG